MGPCTVGMQTYCNMKKQQTNWTTCMPHQSQQQKTKKQESMKNKYKEQNKKNLSNNQDHIKNPVV
jgi:hypothetical protein